MTIYPIQICIYMLKQQHIWVCVDVAWTSSIWPMIYTSMFPFLNNLPYLVASVPDLILDYWVILVTTPTPCMKLKFSFIVLQHLGTVLTTVYLKSWQSRVRFVVLLSVHMYSHILISLEIYICINAFVFRCYIDVVVTFSNLIVTMFCVRKA